MPLASRPTSGLLITYSPPYAPNALMRDNGLALLAAVLKRGGHRVQIHDYCNTDTMRRLVPPKQHEALGNLWNSMQSHKNPKLKDLAHLLWLNRQLVTIQQNDAKKVARELQPVLKEREVDWVGFKLWNGAGFEIPAAIAAELKRYNPRLTIFAGGSHVDYFMEHIFTQGRAFNFLIFGDGETPLLRHANRIGGSGEELTQIPNSIYRIGTAVFRTSLHREIELDSLPFPAYDEKTYLNPNKKIWIAVIDDSRGCDNFCNFCGHSIKSGGKIVAKSPRQIVNEMEHDQNQFGVSFFRFAGSSTPGPLLKGIADEIARRGLKVRFTTFARVKDAQTEDYPTLRAAGHFGQFFGIESGSQKMLNLMGKKEQVGKMEEVVKASMQAGYFTVASLIGYAPGETSKTIQETLDFLARTRPSSVIMNPPMVIPRTPWQMDPRKFGITLPHNYLDRLMRYPVRYLLPMSLWPNFPEQIDGQSSKKIFALANSLSGQIRKLGIRTGLSDDMALMALAAGIDLEGFKKLAQEYFFTGDANGIDSLVKQINQGIIDSLSR